MILIASIIVTSIYIFSLMLFFIHPELSKEAINSALKLSAGSVIPSLFPCFVITNLWICTGHANAFSKKVGGFCEKLFHLPSVTAHALLIGCFGGFPAGAQALLRLYDENAISKDDAEQALLFCSNASPGFVVGFVGSCLFQSSLIGFALWIVHILSALLLGIIFRPISTVRSCSNAPQIEEKRRFLHALPTAVVQASETTLQVCAMVMFFSLISTYLSSLAPADLKKQIWFPIVLGSLELIGGVHSLNGLSQLTAFILVSALISWNGLCVHCQILSSIQTPLSLRKYFLGKLCQILVSVALAMGISKFLPLQTSCAAVNIPSGFHLINLLPIIVILLLYVKTSSGKSDPYRI